MPPLKNWRKAAAEFEEAVKNWEAEWRRYGRTEGFHEGHAEGRIKGLAEGGPEFLQRLAARKYGAGTAERLAGKLAEIADAERTVEVGEWLLECEDGGELLERVERLCAAGAMRGGPSHE